MWQVLLSGNFVLGLEILRGTTLAYPGSSEENKGTAKEPFHLFIHQARSVNEANGFREAVRETKSYKIGNSLSYPRGRKR